MSYVSNRLFGARASVRFRTGFTTMLLVSTLVAAFFVLQGVASAADNGLQGVSVVTEHGTTRVDIRSTGPIGYHYTVYDAVDPQRVVIDLPGMDVSQVKTPIKGIKSPIKDIRVSSFNLASGKLGRVELLLDASAPYDVNSSGNELRIAFGSSSKAAAKPAKPNTAAAGTKVAVAKKIQALKIGKDQVTIQADGSVELYKYFTLVTPPRLVVDVYGAQPIFKERNFEASSGFRQIRVGTYRNKTRFVFDAAGIGLPSYRLTKGDKSLVLSWQPTAQGAGPASTAPAAVAASAAAPASVVPARKMPVAVEALDFGLKGDHSIFTITLSQPGEVTKPVVTGNILRFGIKKANLKHRLRRTIDTSSFPSIIRLITPYTVLEDGSQEVRFAIELKAPTSYDLKQEGNKVKLVVDNGSYAKASVPSKEKLAVPVPTESAQQAAAAPAQTASMKVGGVPSATQAAATPVPAKVAVAPPVQMPAGGVKAIGPSAAVVGAAPHVYTGQKISLVFDDADVRKILQLIADVSGLNIIAGDDVKGTVTLRLVDVPWDQALDLVTDIKGLGMIRQGNVVQVMPKDKIRKMEQARMTASRTKEKLEDLDTDIIPVSYADVSSVKVPVQKLLTNRGKITEDRRNKQLIVTDIPSVLKKVKHLVKLLDLPERQVLIEARIVEANSNFSRDLGVKWGLNYADNTGGQWNLSNASLGLGGSFLLSPSDVSGVSGTSGLGSGFTFGRLGIDNTTLDLKISAMESSGYGKVISSPRVTTMNGATATISQGTEIPYQTTSGTGANATVTVAFKKAVLSLTVTPEINPDGSIFLKIVATNDSKGEDVPTGIGAAPAIDTKTADTKVLVKDGQTTVIGGIFVDEHNTSEDGIPWLGKVPILGHLFKSTSRTDQRKELLIFVTPRILK